MKGRVHELALPGGRISVFRPDTQERLPVMCVHAAQARDWDGYLPRLAAAMGKSARPAMLVCVSPTDWNRDFSPWPAEGLHADSESFAGHADERLALMTDTVLPLVSSAFPTLAGRENTGVLGYSLGGLAALWMLYERPDVFGMAGCLSGSLWYDGFMDWQAARLDQLHHTRIYLSLGRKEERTRHPRLCRIGVCYEETRRLLTERLGAQSVGFALHNGGHGTEVDQRMLQGLLWLLAPQ